MSMCCQRASYEEPLMYDATNTRFGFYDRCPKCMRLTGREANISKMSPLRKSWTAYSEVATREYYRGEGRPMRYRLEAKAGLVPCGWKMPTADGEGV